MADQNRGFLILKDFVDAGACDRLRSRAEDHPNVPGWRENFNELFQRLLTSVLSQNHYKIPLTLLDYWFTVSPFFVVADPTSVLLANSQFQHSRPDKQKIAARHVPVPGEAPAEPKILSAMRAELLALEPTHLAVRPC